jgi:hypothetical protein
MAYTDPQTVTISGTPITLPRVLTGTTVGRFISADANDELTIDPRGTAKRRRNVARSYKKRSVVDPLGSGLSVIVQDMVSITIDRPSTGVTDAEIEAHATGLITWLTASSNANLKKLIAGEN